MDKNCVSMEAAPYTDEILVSNLLLTAAGRRALKVSDSVKRIFCVPDLIWM
jgi:hypothetical protein